MPVVAPEAAMFRVLLEATVEVEVRVKRSPVLPVIETTSLAVAGCRVLGPVVRFQKPRVPVAGAVVVKLEVPSLPPLPLLLQVVW